MGELSDMIGRLGTEAQQATSLERQRAAERAEDQRRSNQRAELIVQRRYATTRNSLYTSSPIVNCWQGRQVPDHK